MHNSNNKTDNTLRRNCKFTLTILLAACFTVLLSMTPAEASFDLNFIFSAKQNSEHPGQISISVTVSPDHMLYRDKMSIKSSAGELKIQWPETTVKKDPFGDDMIAVYPTGNHVFLLNLKTLDKEISQAAVTIEYQGCSQTTCYMPTSREFTFNFSPPVQPDSTIEPETGKASEGKAVKASTPAKPAPVKVEMSNDIVDFSAALADQGTVWVLFLAFLGGLLVSLTPCVYPMIPITLSIIGGRDENASFKKGLGLSLTYVAGLSLTYALLGLAAASFGAQIRGLIQGSGFQGVVAIIFFILGLSMFDLIMIQAPASLRNRLGAVKHSGLGGIFLMGMISGLMASPCVAAPLAGILAFIAATGSQVLGFLMLLLFAWGMSVPLIFIGAFSGSLNSLPRAGEWMNRVKEFYGFLMLAAALYFAKPIIGTAWAELGIAALLAAFAAFLGLFNTIPDSAGMQPKVLKSFGVVAIAVACAFAVSAASQWGCLCLPKSQAEKRADKAEVFWNHDLAAAVEQAGQQKLPVFIDFRADWCSVCHDLELNVFPQPEITALLKRMIPVKIDATRPDEKTSEILKQFGIVGLPTLIILDSDGNERKDLRIIGYISPAQLEKKLRQAL